ncbi:MAG: RNase adapter RapZ [Deltaproteobacteria bacterium]|nr:RNase adapter RapZ [Deltaproteobacteria bacterium]MBW1988539.1 RNase adapter RapZ [Deltaproteobacteria bacterium]
MEIIIITGLSGSGKSTALAALEDAGYYCVDNLPVALLPKFLELPTESVAGVSKLAFVMDLREKGLLQSYKTVFDQLARQGFEPFIIFLEAGDEELLRRYSETRRQHPLSGGEGVAAGIRRERERLEVLRQAANRVIDTSRTNVHELKAHIIDVVGKNAPASRLKIHVTSFGFKYGVPREADLVMDVRFLPNPYFMPELKELSGEDAPAREFVLSRQESREFLERFYALLDYLLPMYERERKSYLTLAFGCTGGRHRSVTIAAEVSRHIQEQGREATLIHRDLRPADADRGTEENL